MSASGKIENDESEGTKQNGYKTKKDRSHIIVLPGTNPEMYKCNICKKVFRNKKGKCYHDSCITGIKPYTCKICEQSFVKRSHFEYHERVHTGYKPFKCSLCDKAFPQRNKLNRHMNSHKHEKEFCCGKCGKRYSKKDDFKNHASLHTGQRPHVCKLCGKSFGILTNLNRHVRTHSKERPYSCELCRKSFKDSSLLIRHKKIHGKERPFSCAHCNRPFLSKSELARHLVIHTDLKPFCCTYCGTIFRRKDNLDRHIRHHHAENNAEVTSGKPEKQKLSNESVSSEPKRPPKKSTKPARGTRNPIPKYGGSAAAELARGNSRDQINSRMDSLGNITPIIRGPGEFSNAVPVINGPIFGARTPVLSASVEQRITPDLTTTTTTTRKKKTYTYTEPIPLAEAVTINRRIEEKLYPQSIANNCYFFRKIPSADSNVPSASGKFSVPAISSTTSSHIVHAAQSDADKSSRVTGNVDNFVSAIRVNENSSNFHETISTHHWRRRTAESFVKSSRTISD